VDRRIKQVTSDRFSKIIDWAGFFRPKNIVFHPGYEKWKFDGNMNLWLESSIETWRPLVQRAEALELTLAIENVFEESPESLLLILHAINSPAFRFCFDTGHHNVFSKIPLPDWIDALGDFLSEVHLHDNHHERDEHLPLGEGEFDFDAFFQLLGQRNLKPILTLEPHEEKHLWRGLKAIEKYIA
jgi:sugar phosphate isomerase/epimerase